MPFGQRVLILPSGYENNEYKRTEGSVQEVVSRFCWMKDSGESNTLEECAVSAQVSICLLRRRELSTVAPSSSS